MQMTAMKTQARTASSPYPKSKGQRLREIHGPRVGQTALWRAQFDATTASDAEMYVPVEVLAFEVKYGRPRFQVTPVGGSGTRWCEVAKLTFPDQVQS
jgi:hypothetical protein